MRRIDYKEGDLINGVKYIKELEPVRVPTRMIRVAEFECACGRKFTARINSVSMGKTGSCGCKKVETIQRIFTTHGMTDTPLHKKWKNMKKRCHNPNHKSYMYYGGRGIVVCEEWRNDFKSFHDYVVGLPNYGADGYTIDRINNEGNYEPGNVRWADHSTQMRNSRACKNYESGRL